MAVLVRYCTEKRATGDNWQGLSQRKQMLS